MSPTIDYTAIISLAVLAVLLAYGLLTWLNNLNGITVREIVHSCANNPGLGMYYGARFFAVCWLVGTMLSRYA